MTDTPETFGARLRRLRTEAGLTQQQLAERANLHKLGVAKIERDERQPSWATVQALARALGVTCSAFEGTVEAEEGEGAARTLGRPRKLPELPESPAEAPAEPEQTQPKRKKRKGG